MADLLNNLDSAKFADTDSNTYLLRLYTSENNHYSHRVRFALKLKNVTIEHFTAEKVDDLPEDVIELALGNELLTLPLLLDRDFVIVQPDIIIHYIDERFPTPPLMPTVPLERARLRTITRLLEGGIIAMADTLLNAKTPKPEIVAKLSDNLISFSYEYFDSFTAKDHEMNMVDCMLGPLLWRLPQMGINVQKSRSNKYQPLIAYMNYIFSQKEFISSCSAEELALYAGPKK